MTFYSAVVRYAGGDVTLCMRCGRCEELCPQKLDIPGLLEIAHKELIR